MSNRWRYLSYGLYSVIHNSLTRFTKSVHLTGERDCNTRPTGAKRNTPKLFAYLITALCGVADVRPIIHLMTSEAARIFCGHGSDSALGQILTEIAVDELVVMRRSAILLVNEVITLNLCLRH